MKSKGALATLSGQFTIRPATLDDVDAAVELINACAIELTGEPRVLAHDVRSDWQQPEFNPETDTLVVLTPEGGIVGHAEMWDRAPHVRLYRGKRKVGLGVDADSLTGATRLYEKAGMHVYRQYVEYEKELRPGEELSTQAAAD